MGRVSSPFHDDRPMKIDHIVLATDLSEGCKNAAIWCHQLKTLVGARVLVEHVIEVNVSNWLKSAYEVLDDPALREQACQKVIAWYRDATGAEPDDVTLRAGSALQQITEVVEGLSGSTLLVMAQTSKSVMSRFFVGSTTQAVASQPPCPMVIVHPEHNRLEKGLPVVVATDFSANADRAIDTAVEFAQLLGSSVHVVHANAAPNLSLFEGGELPQHTLHATSDAWDEQRMDEAVGRHATLTSVPYVTALLDADPADGVVEYAADADSDLLVVGHSGESPVVQNVLGSVARRILKNMPCTVFIVPPIAVDAVGGVEAVEA